MSRATLVGSEGSGRTVVLSLIYATLVRHGGAKDDDLRFHVEPPGIDLLSSLYEELRAGEMPHWPGDSPLTEVRLDISYAHAGASGLLSRALHPSRTPGGASGLQLVLSRLAPERLSEVLRGGGGLTPGAQDLLTSSAILTVLDASLLGPSAHPWDGPLSRLLSSLRAAARDHPGVVKEPVQPVLILSKWDRAPPLQGLASNLSAPGGPVTSLSERARQADWLLQHGFPETRGAFQAPPEGGLSFRAPLLFRSWVRPEPGSGSSPRLKGSLTVERGWEPDFPFREFTDLVAELGACSTDSNRPWP